MYVYIYIYIYIYIYPPKHAYIYIHGHHSIYPSCTAKQSSLQHEILRHIIEFVTNTTEFVTITHLTFTHRPKQSPSSRLYH